MLKGSLAHAPFSAPPDPLRKTELRPIESTKEATHFSVVRCPFRQLRQRSVTGNDKGWRKGKPVRCASRRACFNAKYHLA